MVKGLDIFRERFRDGVIDDILAPVGLTYGDIVGEIALPRRCLGEVGFWGGPVPQRRRRHRSLSGRGLTREGTAHGRGCVLAQSGEDGGIERLLEPVAGTMHGFGEHLPGLSIQGDRCAH